MAEYVSEATRFLRDLINRKPDLERRQREARAIWWDKQLDADEQRRFQQGNVPQQAYVYQNRAGRPRTSGG
jgi:hypothetical protein